MLKQDVSKFKIIKKWLNKHKFRYQTDKRKLSDVVLQKILHV